MREAVTVGARPTMISAKYRLKEERRRMLKLSISKLRRIEDPESALCRSVLINNTVRRLQREQREARGPPVAALDVVAPSPLFADSALTALREEEVPAPTPSSPNLVLEELEDVLSQFYMPPTPRMITSIDEDEDDKRRAAACPVPSKRPRLADSDEEGAGRALADPTNTLEDFKDEVYLRSKPRVPLASAPCANADALRTEHCRRYTPCTGHDRENIAPFGLAGLGALGALGLRDVPPGPAGSAAAQGPAGPALGLQGLQGLQPYSCSQAHGQAQQAAHGLVFHGLMASMES